jgi:uncharacterized protein DUF6088
MRTLQRRLAAAPGTLITAGDLPAVSASAASKALSRLAQAGTIKRVRKGVYYIPKETLLGTSEPSRPGVTQKVLAGKARPTGLTAASHLGLTTQMARQTELAVYATALPNGVTAARTTLRPRSRRQELDSTDGALLEVLRDRGRYSELTAAETRARVVALLRENSKGENRLPLRRLRRLRDAALDEPPRVRAILGALMQTAGLPEMLWRPLGESLNRLSRFDFGIFRDLPNAREWQAK